MKQDDEDDGPTYILEDTKESLTKEEYQALVAGKDSDNKDEDTPQVAANQDSENIAKSKDKISEVGAATKKRKVAKIIGEETTENGEKDAKKTDEKPAKKPKKKTKAIKLSFGDE